VVVIARRIRKEQLRGCAGRVSAAHVREQRRLSREQENPEVRKGVGIANQSCPVGFFHESTTSSSSYPSPIVRARPQHLQKPSEPPSTFFRSLRHNIIAVAKSTIVATDHREEYPSGHSSPTTIPWQVSSSPTKSRHRQVLLIVDSVHRGNSFSTHSPSQLRLTQGLPRSTKSS
jgi:hypothetical protein